VNQAAEHERGSLIHCGLLRWPPYRRLLPIQVGLYDVILMRLACGQFAHFAVSAICITFAGQLFVENDSNNYKTEKDK